MKKQIHILREWDETIQSLPDDVAGIIYAGIHNLVTTGVDTATDELDAAYAETAAKAGDALTMKERADHVGVMTQVIYAQTLWASSILPYYLSQQK